MKPIFYTTMDLDHGAMLADICRTAHTLGYEMVPFEPSEKTNASTPTCDICNQRICPACLPGGIERNVIAQGLEPYTLGTGICPEI